MRQQWLILFVPTNVDMLEHAQQNTTNQIYWSENSSYRRYHILQNVM